MPGHPHSYTFTNLNIAFGISYDTVQTASVVNYTRIARYGQYGVTVGGGLKTKLSRSKQTRLVQ